MTEVGVVARLHVHDEVLLSAEHRQTHAAERELRQHALVHERFRVLLRGAIREARRELRRQAAIARELEGNRASARIALHRLRIGTGERNAFAADNVHRREC
jgi:hypothetical protein